MVKQFTPTQAMALDLDRHLLVEAGAGTGKTTVLSTRYVEHLLEFEQRATLLLPNGPRDNPASNASVTTAPKNQVSLSDWEGLLPTEVVAITFTVKAAEELRQRIRRELLARNKDGMIDPRLKHKEGAVRQLASLLEDSPIGTIDSFLTRLVSPHLSRLTGEPVRDQLDDTERPFFDTTARDVALKLRNRLECLKFGFTPAAADEFLKARDRMVNMFGGRDSAQRIMSRMQREGPFIDEARRALLSKGETAGPFTKEAVRNTTLQLLGDVNTMIEKFAELMWKWRDAIVEPPWAEKLGLNDSIGKENRFASIEALVTGGLPDDDWGRLLWMHHIIHAGCPPKTVLEANPNFLENGLPPNKIRDRKWIGGIQKKPTSAPWLAKHAKLIEIAAKMNKILATPKGRLLRLIANISWELDPSLDFPHSPKTLNPSPIAIPLPWAKPDEVFRIDLDSELTMLRDIWVIHDGLEKVMAHLKAQQRVHDHPDIARLAADLLLSGCPAICATWYPPEMVSALEEGSSEEWMDDHIQKALELAKISKAQDAYEDLKARFELLQRTRRRYRAFIIDECQDTNLSQFRLLSRLWGRRKRESGEVSASTIEWEPTICLVGDRKQSIYRFRQAQVTVMELMGKLVQKMNEDERTTIPRLDDLQTRGYSRDPRQSLILENSGAFTKASDLTESDGQPKKQPRGLIPFSIDASDELATLRETGIIDLATNHRTLPGLLGMMNEWFTDIFSPDHHTLAGDWYAAPQSLGAGKSERDGFTGWLEWLAPINRAKKESLPPKNLSEVIDPFKLTSSKDYELEHELLAARLAALLGERQTKVGDGKKILEEWEDIPCPIDGVKPEDILILVQSRTHMDDLLERLAAIGVPAIADKPGDLLKQPAVTPLSALLALIANPRSRLAAASVARSPLIGLDDKQLEAYLNEKDAGWNLLTRLKKHVNNEPHKKLIQRWSQLSKRGEYLVLLNETVDHSDLLLAYPTHVDRYDIEQFLTLVSDLLVDFGGDAVLVSSRLEEMLEHSNLPSEGVPHAGAVRVMTIHGAKGLQAKVVAITGLFREGHHSLSMTKRGGLMVTPDIYAARLTPWQREKAVESATWKLAQEVCQSQVDAEARRLFYVAATRAEDMLILSGLPKGGTFSREGDLLIPSKASRIPGFGQMFLQSMANRSNDNDWESELLKAPGKSTEKEYLRLNPIKLLNDPKLPGGHLNKLPIYHSPNCFISTSTTKSVFDELKALCENLKEAEKVEGALPNKVKTDVRKANRVVRIAPNQLDEVAFCARRHWLRVGCGLEGERLLLPKTDAIGKDGDADGRLPPANVFGTLFHRLVEIGIPNQPYRSHTHPLPTTWTTPQPNNLLDEETLASVLEEVPADCDPDATRERLEELVELLQKGALGRFVNGKPVAGWVNQGLRTEWGFEATLLRKLKTPWSENHWTPHGEMDDCLIDEVGIQFSGRIDLILCGGNETGGGEWVMAVDLKTDGCLAQFKREGDLAGSLQEITDYSEQDNFTSRSVAELNLLNRHRLQLAMYHLALVEQEEGRIKAGLSPRKVLPPSIYNAANGRLVSWNEEEMDIILSELEDVIQTATMMRISPPPPESFIARKSKADRDMCRICPYHSGDIKVCGPQESFVGPARKDV